MDLTCIGDVNVDVITSKIDCFPKKDAQTIISDVRMTPGGCSANLAKAAALLGLKTRLIGKIGRDFFGEYVREDFRRIKNLDARLMPGSKTGVTVAVTFQDQTRSFLTYPGANGELSIKDIDLDLIRGKYLHMAGFFLQGLRKDTKKILTFAREKGMVTCFDTGFDPRGWSMRDVSLVRKTLSDVDIFFPNLAEARMITGAKEVDEVCDMLLDMGVGIVALKMGKRGSRICSATRRIFVAPYVVPVVDTTGAGDVYGAAFICGHLRKWDLEKIGRFANAAAALKTRGFGSEQYPAFSEAARLSGLNL